MPLLFIRTTGVQQRLICICLPENDCNEASVNTCYTEQIGGGLLSLLFFSGRQHV